MNKLEYYISILYPIISCYIQCCCTRSNHFPLRQLGLEVSHDISAVPLISDAELRDSPDRDSNSFAPVHGAGHDQMALTSVSAYPIPLEAASHHILTHPTQWKAFNFFDVSSVKLSEESASVFGVRTCPQLLISSAVFTHYGIEYLTCLPL